MISYAQLTQIQFRLMQHRARGRVFDAVWMKATTRDNALTEEKMWIGLLAPTQNILHNGNAPARVSQTEPGAPAEKIDLVALGLAKPKPLVRRPLVEPTITRRPL